VALLRAISERVALKFLSLAGIVGAGDAGEIKARVKVVEL
jgi:hypothetical protein